MRKCVVCNKSYAKGSDKSFHFFPKNEVKKKSWLKACKMTLLLPSNKICGDHFLPEHYLPSGYLKSDAIPFLAPISTDIEPSDHHGASTSSPSPKKCLFIEPIAASNTDIEPSDHLYASTFNPNPKKRVPRLNANTIGLLSPSHFSSPRKAMRYLDMVKYKFKQQQIQNTNLKKQIKRLKYKLTTYDDLILKLQQKQFFTESSCS